MFDCVLPTRSGRTGQAFTRDGPINIRNARFAEDKGPLDPDCGCPVCTGWSRAHLHHLVKSGEILGAMLMTQHNICFYQQMMAELRAEIVEGRLAALAGDFLARYRGGGRGARSSAGNPELVTGRSEERGVGNEWVMKGRDRG